jgi:Arc/MetJ-type ribon-helix-helix transcriptional regulator
VKVKKTITTDEELLKWVEQKIDEKEFGSVSHAIEKALTRLKEEYRKEK